MTDVLRGDFPQICGPQVYGVLSGQNQLPRTRSLFKIKCPAKENFGRTIFLWIPAKLFLTGTADQIENLGGDLLLPALVVLKGKVGEEVLAVVRSRLHGHRTGGLLGRLGVK